VKSIEQYERENRDALATDIRFFVLGHPRTKGSGFR